MYTCVLISILKMRMHLSQSLYEILQILGLNVFEKTPLHQLLSPTPDEQHEQNQLPLF